MEHIARNAVALRVSDDDSAKFLRQPLLTESAVAEISVKVCDRQHHLIGIKRLVGNIIFHQQFGGRSGRCCYMRYNVFADTVRKRKMIFFADISVLLPVSPLYYDRPLSGGRKGRCGQGPHPYFEKLWRKSI